jgi:hypothetical protein
MMDFDKIKYRPNFDQANKDIIKKAEKLLGLVHQKFPEYQPKTRPRPTTTYTFDDFDGDTLSAKERLLESIEEDIRKHQRKYQYYP